jgi:hypothetical protein
MKPNASAADAGNGHIRSRGPHCKLKYDHPPLLAPGRHYMCVAEIEALCVRQFTDAAAHACRAKLFYSFD